MGSTVAGSGGDCAHVIPVLRECTWNAPAVSLVLPTFVIPAPWVLHRDRWSILLLNGSTIFSSLLLFRVFLSGRANPTQPTGLFGRLLPPTPPTLPPPPAQRGIYI